MGTTNSAVAFMEGREAKVILTQEGGRLLPSVVAFTQAGERLVGQAAKGQMITNPLNTVSSIKMLIGRRYSEVEPTLDEYSFKIVPHQNDGIRIVIKDQLYSPEEISAMILFRLRESAEALFPGGIEGAIITVPAYFNDSQRQATKDSGTIAGLNVLRIINEPTAASLAYSVDLQKNARIVVYDFGGGTIDISVLEVQAGVIKVLSTIGNTALGGNNFDIKLTDLLVKEFKSEFSLDLKQDPFALQRIREAAENAKIELSSFPESDISLPFIAQSELGPLHLARTVSRDEFWNLIGRDVDETLALCDRALFHAGLKTGDVDEILLVGGSTRIPLVEKKVQDYFGREANKKINPDEIVAMGAAMQGAVIKGDSREILLLDVTPLSLGVKTYGGAFTRVVNANTTIPLTRSLVFSTAEDNQTEVDIHIYQGEREIAEENKFLGKFTLLDIKPAPRGTPRIEVTFNTNINGILKVTACDLSTKNSKEVVISQSSLLNEQEIEKMKKEAEKNQQEDQKRRKLIKKRNNLVTLSHSLKKIRENSDFPAELAARIDDFLAESEQGFDGLDLPALEEKEAYLIHLEEEAAGKGKPGRSIQRGQEPQAGDQPAGATKSKLKEDTRPFKLMVAPKAEKFR